MNKWLCKHFDSEKKGFVTISDVVSPLLTYSTYIAVVVFVIHSMYRFARYPEIAQATSYSAAVPAVV